MVTGGTLLKNRDYLKQCGWILILRRTLQVGRSFVHRSPTECLKVLPLAEGDRFPEWGVKNCFARPFGTPLEIWTTAGPTS